MLSVLHLLDYVMYIKYMIANLMNGWRVAGSFRLFQEGLNLCSQRGQRSRASYARVILDLLSLHCLAQGHFGRLGVVEGSYLSWKSCFCLPATLAIKHAVHIWAHLFVFVCSSHFILYVLFDYLARRTPYQVRGSFCSLTFSDYSGTSVSVVI